MRNSIDINALTGNRNNIVLQGVNRTDSVIRVTESSWQGGTAPVIKFLFSEPSNEMRDLGIWYEYTIDSSDRTVLDNLPAAVDVSSAAGWAMERVDLFRVWQGIKCDGNCGKAVVNDVRISSFDFSIYIDGAQDDIKISKLHTGPFALWTQQGNAFHHHDSIGLEIRRTDGLHISDSIIRNGVGMDLDKSASGHFALILMSNVFFNDNQRNLVMRAGRVSISSSQFHMGINPVTTQMHSILYEGGTLGVVGSQFSWVVDPNSALIYVKKNDYGNDVNGEPYGDTVIISGSYFHYKQTPHSAVWIDQPYTNGKVNLTFDSNYIWKKANVYYPWDMLNISGPARVSIANNRISDRGSGGGAGRFIYIANDDFNRVIGNVGPGWSNSIPCCTTKEAYN